MSPEDSFRFELTSLEVEMAEASGEDVRRAAIEAYMEAATARDVCVCEAFSDIVLSSVSADPHLKAVALAGTQFMLHLDTGLRPDGNT